MNYLEVREKKSQPSVTYILSRDTSPLKTLTQCVDDKKDPRLAEVLLSHFFYARWSNYNL